MYRSWPERRAEQVLRRRRRQDLAERRRDATRKRIAALAQAYAPTPRRRAVSGELIEDVAQAAATVWRRSRQ